MSRFRLDYETSSRCEIKLGAYRYSNDPSTTILLFAVSKDDETPLVWDFTDPDGLESQFAFDLLREASASDEVIQAFNAQFEVAISRYVLPRQLGIPEPKLDQWRCSQALCNRAAIQTNLGGAAKDLGLPQDQQKDTMGKSLIKFFCDRTTEKILEPPPGMKDPDTVKPLKNGGFTTGRKPANRKTASPVHDEEILWDWVGKVGGEKMTVRQAWNRFREYCRQDVVVEGEVARRLAKFELEGDILASFQFDLRMNYKGVPVNRAAVLHAQKLVDQFSERMEVRFKNICGLTSNQNGKLLEWLRERGYPAYDLQAGTIEEVVETPASLGLMAAEAQEIIRMRALLSFAALKKLKSMAASACDDDYIRGTTKWHTARTGRCTGTILQPTNMKKSTIEDSAVAYDLICLGINIETFASLFPSPLEAIASCIRHFIQPHDGLMFDADFVGVEGMLGPWACGQIDKLESILAGQCQYKLMASEVAFDIPYEEVTKAQRQVGKVIELQCIYGAGGRGLRDSLKAMDVDKSLKDCNAFVKKFRERFPKYPQCWRDMEEAAKLAIREGKSSVVADGKIAFGRARYSGITFLVMRLPGGRRLYYPNPQIKSVWKAYDQEEMDEEPWKAERKGYTIDQISFYGRMALTNQFGRVTTWGSRLYENCLTADTEVLTEKGWLPIRQCEGLKVFDGVEWVNHAGLRESLANDVIRLAGLGITRKHMILTSQGWTHAENTDIFDAYQFYRDTCSRTQIMGDQGSNRSTGRKPDSAPHSSQDRSEDRMDVPVRLRQDLRPQDHGAHAVPAHGLRSLLLLLQGEGNSRDSRDVSASGLRGLPEHAGPMQVTHASSVAQLRRSWHHGLQKVAGFLRELLGGHGRRLPEGAYFGPGEQLGKLHESKLPLGAEDYQCPEHPMQCEGPNSPRGTLLDRDLQPNRYREDHHPLSLFPRYPGLGDVDPTGGREEPVYDLLNCGPRHRFVVRAPGGHPLIVHNCIQAMGADLLYHACCECEKEGYDIRMTIYDQALALDNGLPFDRFMEAFCRKQPWAETFPLMADGSVQKYYLKE